MHNMTIQYVRRGGIPTSMDQIWSPSYPHNEPWHECGPNIPPMACTRMSKGECTLDHIHEGCGAVRESVSPQVSGRIHNHVATGIHQELICLPVVGHVRYLGVPGWGVSWVYWWGECVLYYEHQIGPPVIPDG